VTTNCVINELRTLGEDFMGAALAAKRLEKRRCPHGGNPVNAADCIKEIIGNFIIFFFFFFFFYLKIIIFFFNFFIFLIKIFFFFFK